MNMQNLMAQAQKMKRDIEKKQEEINNTNYEGKSQKVEVLINGKRQILNIKIDKSIIEDADDLEALEDMIKIALNEAFTKLDKDTEQKLGVYASGLNGLM
jgi:hypothetical protein